MNLLGRKFHVARDEAVKLKEKIQNIISSHHLINIFQQDKTEIDSAILKALMRGRLNSYSNLEDKPS